MFLCPFQPIFGGGELKREGFSEDITVYWFEARFKQTFYLRVSTVRYVGRWAEIDPSAYMSCTAF